MRLLYFIIISNQREKIVGIYRNICLQMKSNSMSDKYVSSYVHSTLLFPFLLFITAIPFSVIIHLLLSSPSSHRYPPIRVFPSSHRYPPIRVFPLLSPLPSHTCLPPPLTVTLPFVSSPSSQGRNMKLTHTQQLKFHSCVDHTFKTAVMESTSAKQR